MEENKTIEIIGKHGATLSIIEVGLGSLLHALHIPFSGVFLSLNQGYILCWASLQSRELPENLWITYSISNVAAVLKSLSPAGKKLGPMLSLSMQGLLFNIGTNIFGTNSIGLCLGMILLSLWAFIQPLITYYLFFGEKLFTAVEYLYQKTLPHHGLKTEKLIWIFFVLVLTKLLFGCVIAIIAWKRQGCDLYAKKYEEELHKLGRVKIAVENSKKGNAFFSAVKDLFRPLFLVSLIVTGLFLYFSQYNNSQIAIYLLRPIAIGFIFFYISRTLTLDRWLIRLENSRFRTFSRGCQNALEKMRTLL
ncbi:MAG: hypothetical protein WC635_01765 [Bacteriovorax sp.]|jgi:hypothetical protein